MAALARFPCAPSSSVPAPRRHVSCRVTSPSAKLLPDLSERLTLESIRMALIRQEDTIIFSLIERSQFCANPEIYTSGALEVPCFAPKCGTRKSLLEYVLRETEQLHGRLRRYTSPDEYAFFPDSLPELAFAPIGYPTVLVPWAAGPVNFNDSILHSYVTKLVPSITQQGSDNNFGSAVLADVQCLQALSKRTHMGMFVAEAKFRSNRDEYAELIRAGDRGAIMATLTDSAVEERVARRVRNKAATYGQDVQDVLKEVKLGEGDNDKQFYKVDPAIVADLYQHWLMPITKEVQVEYFMNRLNGDDSFLRE